MIAHEVSLNQLLVLWSKKRKRKNVTEMGLAREY